LFKPSAQRPADIIAAGSSSLDSNNALLSLLLQRQAHIDEKAHSLVQLPSSLLDSLKDLKDTASLSDFWLCSVDQHYQHQLQRQQLMRHVQQAISPIQLPTAFQSEVIYRLFSENIALKTQSRLLLHQQEQPHRQSRLQLSLQDGRSMVRSTSSLHPSIQKKDDALLKKLGSTLPRRSDPFVDVSKIRGPLATDEALRRNRGGVTETFPEKLQRMLAEIEVDGSYSHIVGFLPHGRAFAVLDMNQFSDELMPKYFSGQGKWSSFARQLRLYGFLRISAGPDTGAYYHALFLKGRPDLSSCMRRVGAPGGRDRRRKSHEAMMMMMIDSSMSDDDTPVMRNFPVKEGAAPNFYAMDPVNPGTL
jgi:hypothetical protein